MTGAETLMPSRMPIREAADFLNVSIDTVRRRLRRGEYLGEFVDGKWLVDVPEPNDGAAGNPLSALALRLIEQQVEHLRAENTRLTGIIEALVSRDPDRKRLLDRILGDRP
jgi:hypothetical protein